MMRVNKTQLRGFLAHMMKNVMIPKDSKAQAMRNLLWPKMAVGFYKELIL
jgi:hypothetical protein